VGVGQDVGGGLGARRIPELFVQLAGDVHEFPERFIHSDSGNRRWYGDAQTGVVSLGGESGHAVAFQLGETAGADGEFEEKVHVFEFSQDGIISTEVTQGGLDEVKSLPGIQ